jgi:pimeloyl-ACP methyl ester carboxylesterase
VLVVHGGKKDRMDTTMQLLPLCVGLAKEGFNLLAFDRRNCGESGLSGRHSRSRLEWDVGGAVDFVRARYGGMIFLLGVSMGAVACLLHASCDNEVSGIVSDNCFASIYDMSARVLTSSGRVLLPFLWGALRMGRLFYGLSLVSAIDVVGSVKCPVLFINPREDKSVPVQDADRLYQASGNPADEIWLVLDAGHSQAYSTEPRRYIERVTAFFYRCRTGQTEAI